MACKGGMPCGLEGTCVGGEADKQESKVRVGPSLECTVKNETDK